MRSKRRRKRSITKARYVRVGGLDWTVKHTNSKPLDGDTCGLCDFEAKTIWIKLDGPDGKPLDEVQVKRIIVHEMAHASGHDSEECASGWERCVVALVENGFV